MMQTEMIQYRGKYESLLNELCELRAEIIKAEMSERHCGFFGNYSLNLSGLRRGLDGAIHTMLLNMGGA